MESKCECSSKRLMFGFDTPKGSKHHNECPLLQSYLFYWEDAVNAWVPAPDDLASIIGTENIDPGEISEIRFCHFRMTEKEYSELPID